MQSPVVSETLNTFREYLKTNNLLIPKSLQKFCWDNIHLAEKLSRLPQKETKLIQWEENFGKAKNESWKNELALRIAKISEEIRYLKTLKLDAFPIDNFDLKK